MRCIMGSIKCVEKNILLLVDSLKSKSSVLNSMLDDILNGGDLTLHLLAQNHSYYNDRNIGIGLQVGGGTEISISSELIMEICNAWYDTRGCKPDMSTFHDADSYAEAVEEQEWRAVKKHVKIFKQLESNSAIYAAGNRFRQAFTDPRYDWGKFKNYLAFQINSGHTKMIASHYHP